jgi:hypothetical protein
MYKWKVMMTVNGIRTEEIVCAYTSGDATKLAEWRYYGQRVCVFTYTRL